MYNFYYKINKEELIEYLKAGSGKIRIVSSKNAPYSHVALHGKSGLRFFKGKIAETDGEVRITGSFRYPVWIKSIFAAAAVLLAVFNIRALMGNLSLMTALPFAGGYLAILLVVLTGGRLCKKREKSLMGMLSEKAFKVSRVNGRNGLETIISPTWTSLFDGSCVCITDEERTMYENGEMAPMAYTYLMKLTYHWFLADTDEDREYCRRLAESFRENGYKTTGGCYPKVDEGIEFMPSKPQGELTEEEHYFRNRLNIQFGWDLFQKLQERLPDELKWDELSFFNSIFHKFDLRGLKYKAQGNNRKYVSACGHFEIVFTKENHLVNMSLHNTYMGTYNFYTYKNPGEHKRYDVIPWKIWGTVDDDEVAL